MQEKLETNMDKPKINIYGDSFMRGTIIDENYRYHSIVAETIKEFSEIFGLDINNRARFGITVEKGEKILQNDLAHGLACDYAVIEFGGNDCSFKWNEVSAFPEMEHEPLTALSRFKEVYRNILASLKNASITPILMTLPPIDAEKHLRYIGRGDNDSTRILGFLGDVQMIYRFHELYSRTIAEIAARTNTLLIDVRSRFLDKRNYHKLIGLDGVHLNVDGYKLAYDVIREFVAQQMEFVRGRQLVCV